jgi:hypothetical protein
MTTAMTTAMTTTSDRRSEGGATAMTKISVAFRTVVECGSAPRLAPWSAPVQGIRMPDPASRTTQTSTVGGAMSAAAANDAAKSVSGKHAMGDEAFEDPV